MFHKRKKGEGMRKGEKEGVENQLEQQQKLRKKEYDGDHNKDLGPL